MAFLKKHSPCLQLEEPASVSTVRSIHGILQSFLEEKEQYEHAFNMEREQTKAVYESSLELKTQQLINLTSTITQLQNLLLESRN
jgi:hypothetical protein